MDELYKFYNGNIFQLILSIIEYFVFLGIDKDIKLNLKTRLIKLYSLSTRLYKYSVSTYMGKGVRPPGVFANKGHKG